MLEDKAVSGNTRDQTGIPADAVNNFRRVLLKIYNGNERKVLEKQVTDETINTAATMINDLEWLAKKLVALSDKLQRLAAKHLAT